MKKLIQFLIFLLLIIVLINYTVGLIVFSSDNGVIKVRPIFMWATEIELRYIHSVAQTPVSEYFEFARDGFTLNKTVFDSYGAGLPLDGGDFRRENGKFVQEGQNIKIDELVIRVSRTEGQELIVSGDVYDLQLLVEPGQRLFVNSYSPWNYLRFRLNNAGLD